MSEEKCAWCGKTDHKSTFCPTSNEEKLRRSFQAIADKLIDGDYIGPLRGEVNVCLNVIHYHLAFEEAAEKSLPREKIREIKELTWKIRAEKYGRLLW